MIEDIYFKDQNSDTEINKTERLANATVEMEKARQLASDSTKEIPITTKRKTLYFVNMSDLHIPEGNMLELIEKFIEYAKIPGMLIGLGGDLINNSVKNSIGDTHGEVISPENQIRLFATILKKRAKEENIELKDVVAFVRSGNHENRTFKDVAIDPAYITAEALGLTNRYAKNIAKVVIEQLDEQNMLVAKHIIQTAHAEQKPGKAGAQADDGLISDLNYGADVVVYEHNHKIMTAAQSKEFRVASRVNPVVKTTTYVNFGAEIAGGEYADRAGYPFPRKSDKEVLRITSENKQKHYDMINYRSLVDAFAEEKINKLETVVKNLEESEYKSELGIKKTYSSLAKKVFGNVVAEHNNFEQSKEEYLSKSGLSDKIYFAPLSGFDIGNESKDSNEKDIEEKINILAKLNGSCKVALTGNIVHYKKAVTLINKNGNLLGEKFPEESFAYLEKAANLLKPIKNKIFVMSSGENERKLMKYQSEALAKMGITRLQMPESQCYMPYNKTKLEAEQLKIQAKQVEAYNKSILAKAVENALKDVTKAFTEALPYKIENYAMLDDVEKEDILQKTINTYNAKLLSDEKKSNEDKKASKKAKSDEKMDFLKDIISAKLRAEGEFLSLSKDANYINYKFPLEEIELREPHENLIQNILCALLEIDPKNIAINPDPAKSVYSSAKLKDDRGRSRTIEFFGGFSNSGAGRSSIENKLKGSLSAAPGAHVYYTNTKLGKEFVLLEKQIFENPFTDKTEKKDAIFISGGTFSKDISNSVNKIYKLFAVSDKQEQEVTSNIYDNVEEHFKLYCESLNYETVLLDKDVVPEILKNIIKRSYKKALSNFANKKLDNVLSNGVEEIDNSLENVLTKKSGKKDKSNEMQ